METICDNKSVGVIIENTQREVLLIERAKFPLGLAAPAGHIDTHGTPVQAALEEVNEEVGLSLQASDLREVISARRVENTCRRSGGNYHDWWVYYAQDIDGEITRSIDETKAASWYSRTELQHVANITRDLGSTALGFELIWLDFFTELGFVK